MLWTPPYSFASVAVVVVVQVCCLSSPRGAWQAAPLARQTLCCGGEHGRGQHWAHAGSAMRRLCCSPVSSHTFIISFNASIVDHHNPMPKFASSLQIITTYIIIHYATYLVYTRCRIIEWVMRVSSRTVGICKRIVWVSKWIVVDYLQFDNTLGKAWYRNTNSYFMYYSHWFEQQQMGY